MTINIRVTTSSATLSCMHKGQMMTKKVQAMYPEKFEVAAILQNLAKGLEAVKTDLPIVITLVGSDYVSNIVKGTEYLRHNCRKDFKKPNGSDAYMAVMPIWQNIGEMCLRLLVLKHCWRTTCLRLGMSTTTKRSQTGQAINRLFLL